MGNNYVTCEEGKSQYGDQPIKGPVEARYIRPLDPDFAGNPLIEALPLPRTGNDTIDAYTQVLKGYDPDKAFRLDRLEKLLQIRKLREVRASLPFDQSLEDDFYTALVDTYSRRELIPTDDDQTCIVEDKEVPCGNILVGDPGDATYGYFSVTGFGGTGKSSAIKILKSHYPQAIRHSDGKNGYFTQIVYLVVVCKPNGNIKSLFDSIGNAVDMALRNTKHTHRDKVQNQRDMGKKVEAVEDLIETFSVGAIIFDEIQLLDNTGTSKQSSYSYLLDLMNETKISMITVGTQDAREHLFPELHTARRTGATIDASAYCDDRDIVFPMLVRNLFHYQWCPPEERVEVVKNPAEATKEEVDAWNDIVDTLYELTKGIVDNLVTLYSRAWVDYINRPENNKPKINGAYFRKIAYKYYPGIQTILKQMDYEGLFDANKKVKDDMYAYIDDESQKPRPGS